jgi:proteasome alpha subunit
MTEEPFRWLEAVANRREYVAEQLKGGAPVFAAALLDGVLLAGVGGGSSKVFEIFDRQAMAALGHPADIEKIRQTIIDAAHVEAFTRAPEDVSLRRLVGFGLSPQLKTNFEQLFSAPFLAELLLAELGPGPESDVFFRLRFDGSFEVRRGGAHVAAPSKESEATAQKWLNSVVSPRTHLSDAVDFMLQGWWMASLEVFPEVIPPLEERQKGWRAALGEKIVEVGWLDRRGVRPSRYQALTLSELGLT